MPHHAIRNYSISLLGIFVLYIMVILHIVYRSAQYQYVITGKYDPLPWQHNCSRRICTIFLFVAMVTVYKQLYLNVISQPRTKTIVGICRSAHENMTAVANDNSEHNHHEVPLDLSAFYICSWRILSTKCIFSTQCSLSVKMQSGRLVSNSDPPPGLKGSLSMRLSGHVATQQLIKWVILIVQQ